MLRALSADLFTLSFEFRGLLAHFRLKRFPLVVRLFDHGFDDGVGVFVRGFALGFDRE